MEATNSYGVKIQLLSFWKERNHRLHIVIRIAHLLKYPNFRKLKEFWKITWKNVKRKVTPFLRKSRSLFKICTILHRFVG